MKTIKFLRSYSTCITLLVSTFLFIPLFMAQEATTIFSGIPTQKISEGGIERTPEKLPREKGVAARCVISKIGEFYYWASRDNVKMTRIESGAFITFLASNGAGYVRAIKPELKEVATLMSNTEKSFDYVEHITIGLRSVTYFGQIEK